MWIFVIDNQPVPCRVVTQPQPLQREVVRIDGRMIPGRNIPGEFVVEFESNFRDEFPAFWGWLDGYMTPRIGERHPLPKTVNLRNVVSGRLTQHVVLSEVLPSLMSLETGNMEFAGDAVVYRVTFLYNGMEYSDAEINAGSSGDSIPPLPRRRSSRRTIDEERFIQALRDASGATPMPDSPAPLSEKKKVKKDGKKREYTKAELAAKAMAVEGQVFDLFATDI